MNVCKVKELHIVVRGELETSGLEGEKKITKMQKRAEERQKIFFV